LVTGVQTCALPISRARNVEHVGIDQVPCGQVNLPPRGVGLEQVTEGRLRVRLLNLLENLDRTVRVSVHEHGDSPASGLAQLSIGGRGVRGSSSCGQGPPFGTTGLQSRDEARPNTSYWL